MKQTLSVADFAIILDLLNERILDLERPLFLESCVKGSNKIIEERLNKLKRNSYYLSLLHLKESLQNLNIDVDTPSVEVENKGE